MPNDYVNLKNLQGAEIKPITDLAAINLTEVNGIAVEGNTIGIQDGYIESAYYTEMVDPTVGPAASSSAYVEGGTIYTLLGGYAVTSAINTASPSQQKVPSEAAVVSAFDDIVVSGASYYAGTGINIDAGHTVSVANVPTSAVAGLDTQLTGISASVAGKQDAISAGYRMELSGTTLSQARYFPIESPTSSTITLQAGHAYKIQATTGSKTLTAETIPANQFGLEGHAEIFIANTGLIKTTSSVVLANHLEPDSVNNCTLRFHDGMCYVSVEDHIAGYIVVAATGTTAGTLPYGITSATQEYIAFDATTNGSIINLGGTTASVEKHLVGNGYTSTTLTGAVDCGTSKFTVANLALQDVQITGGVMTLGDAYIPSGSTVAVSGGGLAVEKVTGNGGVIDLGGSAGYEANAPCFYGGVTIIGGTATFGPAGIASGGATATISNCVISANTAGNAKGGAFHATGANLFTISSSTLAGNTGYGLSFFYTPGLVKNCVFSDNTRGAAHIAGNTSSIVEFNDNTFDAGQDIVLSASAPLKLGNNTLKSVVSGSSGFVTITSGAILDLTGNTNAAPIAPGGGITFEAGGATVLYSSGAVSGSYSMDNVNLPAGAKLTNTATVDLGGTNVLNSGNANASGVVFSGGSASLGGAVYNYEGATANYTSCTFANNRANNGAGVSVNNSATVATLIDCTISGNTASAFGGGVYCNASATTNLTGCRVTANKGGYGGGLFVSAGAKVELASCDVSGNTTNDIYIGSGGSVTLKDSNTIGLVTGVSGTVTISSGASINLTSSINPGGTITVLEGGCSVNGNLVSSGTYTEINADGSTVPPQA